MDNFFKKKQMHTALRPMGTRSREHEFTVTSRFFRVGPVPSWPRIYRVVTINFLLNFQGETWNIDRRMQ